MPRSVDTTTFVLPSGQAVSSGISVVAGITDTPPNERRVRWVKETDGALVADISAYNQTASGIDPPYGTQGALTLRAKSDLRQVSLSLLAYDSTLPSSLSTIVDTQAVTVMDSTARSSFLQTGTPTQSGLAVVRATFPGGSVTSNFAAIPGGVVTGMLSGGDVTSVGSLWRCRVIPTAGVFNITADAVQPLGTFVDVMCLWWK